MRLVMIGAGIAALAAAGAVGYVTLGQAEKRSASAATQPSAPRPAAPGSVADPPQKVAAVPAIAPPTPPAQKPVPLPASAPASAPAPASTPKVAALPPPKVGKMTGDQVKQHFFTGEKFFAQTPQGVAYRMAFAADGKMTREPAGKAGVKAEGTWKVQKDGFCTQWKGSPQNCYGVVFGNDGKYNVMKGTTVVGVWSKATN
jgi:hypothetical protein